MSDETARAEWVKSENVANPLSPGTIEWMQFSPSRVVPPEEALRLPSDAWPFLYLRAPMIPALSLRGMLVMGVAGALFLMPFLRHAPGRAADAAAPTHASSPRCSSWAPGSC